MNSRSALQQIPSEIHHIAASHFPRSVQTQSSIPESTQIQCYRPGSVISSTSILIIDTSEIAVPGSPHFRGAVTTLVTEHPRRCGVAAGVLRPQPAAVHPGRRHRHRQSQRLHRSSSIRGRARARSLPRGGRSSSRRSAVFMDHGKLQYLARYLLYLGTYCTWNVGDSRFSVMYCICINTD